MTRHTSRLHLIAAAIAASGLGFGAFAQGNGGGMGGGTGAGSSTGTGAGAAAGTGNSGGSSNAKAGTTVASGDARFVQQASANNQAEIELGRLGTQHAASDSVKQFASQMVDDHGKAGDQLKQIAGGKSLALSEQPDAAHRRVIERLGKMNGAEFDRAFVRQMVQDHQKTVELFQRQARAGEDKDLKAFADSTLPTLRQHLEHARSLEREVEGGAGRGAGPSIRGGAQGGGEGGGSNGAGGAGR